MSENSAIAWTKNTWNPWMGCAKVSPGCAHCYMFRDMKQYGRDPETVVRSKTKFSEPLKWQKRIDAGESKPLMCFTCSWSDWFHEAADAWRDEAWDIIRRTPGVFYQVLTKRHERIADHLPSDWGAGYPNVALMVSIENDRFTHRADALRAVPARVKGISAEPLLSALPSLDLTGIDWIIVGGESGSDFRPMNLEWARELLEKARAQGTAFFFKQSAAYKPGQGADALGALYQEFPAAMRDERLTPR